MADMSNKDGDLESALARLGISLSGDEISSLAQAFEARRNRAGVIHRHAPLSPYPAFTYAIPEETGK